MINALLIHYNDTEMPPNECDFCAKLRRCGDKSFFPCCLAVEKTSSKSDDPNRYVFYDGCYECRARGNSRCSFVSDQPKTLLKMRDMLVSTFLAFIYALFDFVLYNLGPRRR